MIIMLVAIVFFLLGLSINVLMAALLFDTSEGYAKNAKVIIRGDSLEDHVWKNDE